MSTSTLYNQPNVLGYGASSTALLSASSRNASTVAALKALTTMNNGDVVAVLGYYAAGDGGGGDFIYSSTSTATDDGGTVITPNTGTGRWLRTNINGEIPLEAFGAKGDGSDDQAALNKACASGYRLVGGGPTKTYVVKTAITVSASMRLDLKGATMKPSGAVRLFERGSVAATQTSTVSSGATIGSNSLTVASGSGFAIGQICWLTSSDSPSRPPCWNTIKNVSGTTITLSTALPIDYDSGTTTLNAYATSSFIDTFELTNGIIDGSATTQNSVAQGVYLERVLNVNIRNIAAQNFTNNGSETTVISIWRSRNVYINFRNTGFVSQNQAAQTYFTQTSEFHSCYTDGSGFGFYAGYSDSAKFLNNDLFGRRTAENLGQFSGTSVRGIKTDACSYAEIVGNRITDYQAGLKLQETNRYVVTGNRITCNGIGDSSSAAHAINVDGTFYTAMTQYGQVISGNIIDKAGGVGISLSFDTGTGNAYAIIKDNIVRNVGTWAINCAQPALVMSNVCVNWGQVSTGAAIKGQRGGILGSNQFENSDNTMACYDSSYTAGFKISYLANDISNSGNPILASSKYLENSGSSSITSGNTSVSVTHGLYKTPTADQIIITPTNSPTNSVGAISVQSIGATTFSAVVRADPGASGATFNWRAKVAAWTT